MMTRRERVIAALEFKAPDKVPFEMSFTQNMRKRMIAYTGKENFEEDIDSHIAITWLNKPLEEIRPEYFRDEYGVVWNRSGVDKDIGVVEKFLLEDAEDLTGFELPPVDEAFIREQIETMLERAGDRFRLVDFGFSLFERAWILRGMENLLCDMIAEPEFVHDLLDRITDRNMQVLEIALQYDIDCFHFGDDWGQQRGLIMGPNCWRTYIKPRLKRMYDRIHAAGKYVSQHSCGDIREIMEDLHEIGLNMYQTFQPEIYGYDYAEKLYGKITVWGGMSTQRDLPNRTPDEIRQITRRLMEAFPNGGLVAAPTHSVPGDVPPENIMAMLDVLNNQ